MNYEITELKEMHIIGPAARTSNSAPDMGLKIGSLWQKLFSDEGLSSIPQKTGPKTYGLYTNYESDMNGLYDAIVGCSVQTEALPPAGMTKVHIPGGTYARFSAEVDTTNGSISEVWKEIWSLPLNRAYTVDFEEYLPSDDKRRVPINIYIALAD